MPPALDSMRPAPKLTFQPDESKPLVVVPPAALGPAAPPGAVRVDSAGRNEAGTAICQSRAIMTTNTNAPPSNSMLGVMVSPAGGAGARVPGWPSV